MDRVVRIAGPLLVGIVAADDVSPVSDLRCLGRCPRYALVDVAVMGQSVGQVAQKSADFPVVESSRAVINKVGKQPEKSRTADKPLGTRCGNGPCSEQGAMMVAVPR